MGLLVSMGGLIFGFDTGQISGFLEMQNFLENFGEEQSNGSYAFSNVRSGLIVALLSVGTLLGALAAAPIADRVGRKYSITFWCIIFIVGVIVQITSTTNWVQIALGRWTAGWGVGGLSVLTPMYMSEISPRQVRGALVSCYQLFITLGIFIAYCINYGTHAEQSRASWRITMGVGFIWPTIMGIGVLFLRESPRWEYRKGRHESARETIAKVYGVHIHHHEVHREMFEIKQKLDAETAGGGRPAWYECVTGPRMLYRTLLGMALQMLQQLTGANYFFYFGTSIFKSVGIQDSYVISMILGAVNFICTFPGLYFVEHAGRRKSLIYGALWMFVCFVIFASVGTWGPKVVDSEGALQPSHASGTAMIVFTCLFIAAFASTWGPMVWAIVGEIYPSRYRATCMALATSSNWIWNFLLSFFTSFITADIGFLYGFVFAGCCLAAAVVVFLFVEESSGRTLEEIDTMYILHVTPWKSAKWEPPEGEDLVTADKLNLERGGRGIRKDNEGPSQPGLLENADSKA